MGRQRDSELLKIILTACVRTLHPPDLQVRSPLTNMDGLQISNLMFTRGVFPTECFQILSREHFESAFRDLIDSSGPAQEIPKEGYLDVNTFLFPRRHPHKQFGYFLSLLEGSIFPAIEDAGLVKLLLCFFDSRADSPESLVEFFKIKFYYHEDDTQEIVITWSGIDRLGTETQTGGDAFCDMAETLKTLPCWTGPMYNMFLIYPKAGYPDRFGSGWHLDYDVTTAETALAQRPGFSTFVMSQLAVSAMDVPEPARPKQTHAEPEKDRGPKANVKAVEDSETKRTGSLDEVSGSRSGRRMYDLPVIGAVSGHVHEGVKPGRSSTKRQARGTRAAKSTASKRPGTKKQRKVPPRKAKDNGISQSQIPVFEKVTNSLPATQKLESQSRVQTPNDKRHERGAATRQGFPEPRGDAGKPLGFGRYLSEAQDVQQVETDEASFGFATYLMK